MSESSIPDAGVGRQVPITRRSAIRTGALATIAAGLLGTTRSADASAPVPLVVAPVSNIADLVAEVAGYIKAGDAAWHAQEAAEADLRATMSPEQDALFVAYDRARSDGEYLSQEMYLAELARHFPGLAPALWGLWDHIVSDGRGLGSCCLPTGGPS